MKGLTRLVTFMPSNIVRMKKIEDLMVEGHGRKASKGHTIWKN